MKKFCVVGSILLLFVLCLIKILPTSIVICLLLPTSVVMMDRSFSISEKLIATTSVFSLFSFYFIQILIFDAVYHRAIKYSGFVPWCWILSVFIITLVILTTRKNFIALSLSLPLAISVAVGNIMFSI